MPSFDLYRRLHSAASIGEAHKKESDMVMEATWDNDINTRVCYLYDYFHDDHKTQLTNLDPVNESKKVAISLKWRRSSAQTMDKDVVDHHIQMKPSQEMNVDYYPAFFEERYQATWPVGLYVDIPDEKGIYNRWLIVAVANYHVSQFPTFSVLPCDFIFNWIYKGKKYKMAGCLRNQNSYNSGIWTDHIITAVEDQQKFIVPMNSVSEQIYYNQRMIIDNKIDVKSGNEPRTWKISKVNRINSNGTLLATLAQDKFNAHTDYIEYENDSDPSTIIGMWADYYSTDGTVPSEDTPPSEDIHSVITYVGKPNIKVGGSYKKFTVIFYDHETVIDHKLGNWSFEIDGVDASSLVQTDTTDVEANQIRVRFIGSEDYMGKILKVTYSSTTGIVSSVDILISGA